MSNDQIAALQAQLDALKAGQPDPAPAVVEPVPVTVPVVEPIPAEANAGLNWLLHRLLPHGAQKEIPAITSTVEPVVDTAINAVVPVSIEDRVTAIEAQLQELFGRSGGL